MSWGKAGSGMAAGAGIGAVAGAPAGGIGAVPGALIGGVAGGALGLMSPDTPRADPYNDWMGSSVSEEAAMQRGQRVGEAGLPAYQQGLQSYASLLNDPRQGVGYQTLQRGEQMNAINARSLAASQRGVDPAAAMRMAMAAQTQAHGQTNMDAGLLAAQEANAARGALMSGGLQGVGANIEQQNAYANRVARAYEVANNQAAAAAQADQNFGLGMMSTGLSALSQFGKAKKGG